MRNIFYGGNAPRDSRFYLYGNERDDGFLCGKYDDVMSSDITSGRMAMLPQGIICEAYNIFPLNLQFFAEDGPGGEKTEEPTSKKLEDARKEGQVAKSREIANGLGIFALFLVLQFWVGNMGKSFMELFELIYA